ncbi:hypothetical protein F4861DRAFT_537360 [Xylaria intraflava]|nr:hypothetical protein F4861DRAFT_537360 [Xylaria intraflava]
MAAWGGSGDGQIAPNHYLHQNATTATTTTTASTTSTSTSTSASAAANNNISNIASSSIGIGGLYNDGDDTRPDITHAVANANANAHAGADSLDYLLGTFDNSVPDFHHLVDCTVSRPCRHSFSPQSSLQNSDSFAVDGDTFPSLFHTTPSTNSPNFPVFRVGGLFHDPLYPPPSQALPTAPASAQAYQRPHSSAVSPGQLITSSDDYSSYEVRRNHQLRSQSDFWGSTRNSYHPDATTLLSFAATLPQPHMNNENPRQTPPIYQTRSLPRVPEVSRRLDDVYLTALAQDFSSPSLPPLSSSPPPPQVSLPSFGRLRPSATGQEMSLPSNRRRIPGRVGVLDLSKQEPDFEAPSSGLDTIPTMPPVTRMRSLGVTDSPARKRRPSVTSPSSRPNKARRKGTPASGDQLYALENDIDVSKLTGHDDFETVDLSNATEVPAELMTPKVDNRVKISKFQCVICMDDTTALTVTHCGHLFCSGCLHSSLHIDSMKRTCPVCRSKVDLKDKKGKTVKSYYHLELKIMTATKMGKRPAGA